jgi:transposase-like protein
MEKIGRPRRSEGAWREIVERHEQSGLTVAAFCQREGIKSASLYGWRSRLREGVDGKPAALTAAKATKRSKAVEAPAFIDLGSLGSIGSRFEIRLELGHGVALHLVRG